MNKCKKFAKKCFIDLAGKGKSSTFAPAFERETQMSIEMLDKDKGLEPPLKKLFLKFFLKSFGGSEKILTFASAFRKKAMKKSSLKDLDINKQVVQVLLK